MERSSLPRNLTETVCSPGIELVYKTLGALVGNEIHALSITALTPDEWRQRSGES